MKYFLLLILQIPLLFGCNQTQVIPQKNDFTFDLCNATYKGNPIPLNKPIEEWVKLFGRYDRIIDGYYFIWDSLGITLAKFNNYDPKEPKDNDKAPDQLLICFVNTTSPFSKENKYDNGVNKLELDAHFRDNDSVYIKNSNNNYEIYKPNFNDPNYFFDPFLYPYPIKAYIDTVIVDGGVISGGMTLKEINKYRTQIKDNGKFVLWRKGIDWHNETGSTTIKTGEFIDTKKEKKESRCGIEQGFFYYTFLRYTEGVLEYIKIEKVVKKKSIYWQ